MRNGWLACRPALMWGAGSLNSRLARGSISGVVVMASALALFAGPAVALSTAPTQVVSVLPNNQPMDARSGIQGSMSGDGRHVVFWAGIAGQSYLRDRWLEKTTSAAGADQREAYSISPNGQWLAYWSFQYHRTIRVKNVSTGVERTLGFGSYPIVADDGTVAAIRAGASGAEAVIYDAGGAAQVGSTSVTSNPPDITPDGRYVTWVSVDYDLILLDRVTGQQEQIASSVVTDGAPAGRMSHDGRYVVFTSTENLVNDGDTSGDSDVFLRDRVTGTTRRISAHPPGQVDLNENTGAGVISGDGRSIVYWGDRNIDPTWSGPFPSYGGERCSYIYDIATQVSKVLTISNKCAVPYGLSRTGKFLLHSFRSMTYSNSEEDQRLRVTDLTAVAGTSVPVVP